MVNYEADGLVGLPRNTLKRLQEAELFTRRFGSFSKSDYEVLMFTIYLDSLSDEPVYDYLISQKLGITESKVRSLRVKSQLLYPKDIPWKQVLSDAIKNGNYNEKDNTLTITIEDPSCQARIRYEIESSFGTANLNLNSKQLTVPIESLLAVALAQESDKEKILAELNKAWLRGNKLRERITRESLVKRIFKGAGDVAAILGVSANAFESAGNIVEAMVERIKPVEKD